MTDAAQPDGANGGGYDPWAPPESRPSLDKDQSSNAGQPPADTPVPPASAPRPPGVHDQATVTSMPAASYPPPDSTPSAGYPQPGSTTPVSASPFDTPASVPPPPVAPAGPAPGGMPGGYGYPGYPQSYGGWPGAPMQPQNGMGIAAMVLGILACALFCFYGVVSVILGILAVVFGIKGRKRVEQGIANNHGQAQAGLITGIIGIVLGLVVLVLLAVGITAAINSDDDPYDDDYYGAAQGAAVVVAQAR
ncbi:DUF4190 domain-containing protein [Streptomyces sp. NPDC088387]|uniref:DUF4190 domain-containing protein n=1 Tax=Streptomyces sp. NPDC088387 TaxID=3365859 RepID=UPI003830EC78